MAHKLDESLLAQLPPFAKLQRGQIRDILDLAVSKRFEPEQVVFREAEPASHFYMLLDGYIRVIRISPEGEQVIALHIPAGQLFGIASAIGRDSYPATAITTADSIVLSWPSRLWPQFTANYDGFATETYKVLGNRIGEMNNRVLEMATQQVEQRVANALLRLINQTGRKTADGIVIDFPITRQNISEMTGTTLHTVSRLLSAWQKQGIIESQRKRVMVRQPHQLVVLAQGPLTP